jgi:hypothetical protein
MTKRLLALLLFALPAFAQRIPQINLYTGNPYGLACTGANTLVQSTTTGGVYACVGGVYATPVVNGAPIAPSSVVATGPVSAPIATFGGPRCNVVFLGADPTGTSNSLPAINSCISYLTGLNGGTVYIPAGNYKITAAIVAGNGIWFEGDGPYPSSSIRGTHIFTTSTTDDVFRVPDGIGYTGLRDVYLQGNTSGTAGHGVNISSVTATGSHMVFQNVVVQGAAQNGWMLQAGQGTGGYLFDVIFDHIMSMGNNGDGVHAIGRWGELIFVNPFVDSNPTGNSYSFDGDSAGDGGEVTFMHPVSGISETAFVLHNMSIFDIIDPHIEASSVAQIAISSARRGKIGGGACSIRQVGIALGITFTSSLWANDSIEIDCPSWTNTTSNTLISYLGGSVINVLLGSTSNGPFTRANITGTEYPNNGFLFKPVMSQNAAPPTNCFAGELYYDSGGNTAGICLTANTPTTLITPLPWVTWTATDASAGGLTFSTQSLHCKNIAYLETCQGSITWPATADTHQAELGGLPVAIAANSGGMVPTASTYATPIVAAPQASTSHVYLYTQAGIGALQNASLTGATVYLSFSYPTN